MKGRVVVCPFCQAHIDISHAQEGASRVICPNCGVSITIQPPNGGKVEVAVEGKSADEVEKVASAMVEKVQRNSTRERVNPWASGSFYLAVFVIAAAVVLAVVRIVPVVALPLVLVICILVLSIIGAFQLRHDERLSESGFLKLMALAFKRVPWIKK